MATIHITKFNGEAPKIPPRNLPEGFAQIAIGCDLQRGTLAALLGNTDVVAPSKKDAGLVKSIHHYLSGDKWFNWIYDTDVVKAPIAGDTTLRTYFAQGDNGTPQTTNTAIATGGPDYPTVSYTLAVYAPLDLGSMNIWPQDQTSDDSDRIDCNFTYTYVTASGEESAPFSTATLKRLAVGDEFTAVVLAATGDDMGAGAKYRLYCSVYGEYQYTAEWLMSSGTTSPVLTFDTAELAEIMPSIDWNAPPNDLHSIVLHPGGFLVGSSKNEICFSEAYIGHAWPAKYRMTLDDDIVGLAIAGNAVIIATKKGMYMSSGNDPAGMSKVKIETEQVCISKRSIVAVGDAVVLATPDGLMAIAPGGPPVNITKNIYTQAQWQAKIGYINGVWVGTELHAYAHESEYLFFYNNGGASGGIAFNPKERNGVKEIGYYANAGYRKQMEDRLYVSVGVGASQMIRSVGTGTALSYIWKSKIHRLPDPLSFGWAMVRGDGAVTISIYLDGAVIINEKTVTMGLEFRLPAKMGREWEVELKGTGTVEGVILAETAEEL